MSPWSKLFGTQAALYGPNFNLVQLCSAGMLPVPGY